MSERPADALASTRPIRSKFPRQIAAGKEDLVSFPFDHMYACNSDSNDTQLVADAGDRAIVDSEVRQLKELLLLHLDLIQHQSEQLVDKDKVIAALRQENEALKVRLERRGSTPAKHNSAYLNNMTHDCEPGAEQSKDINNSAAALAAATSAAAAVATAIQFNVGLNERFPDDLPKSGSEPDTEDEDMRSEKCYRSISKAAIATPCPSKYRGVVTELTDETRLPLAVGEDDLHHHHLHHHHHHLHHRHHHLKPTNRRKRLCSSSSQQSAGESASTTVTAASVATAATASSAPRSAQFRRKAKGAAAAPLPLPLPLPLEVSPASVFAGREPLVTDALYLTRAGDADPSLTPEDLLLLEERCLEVPRWRVKVYTSCYTMEGTENLDDEVYNKRHLRLENDERRRKRWDFQRIREQRHIEKLKQRQERVGSGARSDEQEPPSSLWPSLEDVRYIEVTEALPVSAFGAPIAAFAPSEFRLPWLNGFTENRKNSNRKSTGRRKPQKR